MQWGEFIGSEQQTITLPISFTTTNYTITLSISDKYDARGYRWSQKNVHDFKITRISGSTADGSYHVIGFQQWGYCSDNQGFSARMITFPLGFQNVCYLLIASTKSESTKLAYNSGNGIVLSKTQAKIVFDNEGGYWFAVGR